MQSIDLSTVDHDSPIKKMGFRYVNINSKKLVDHITSLKTKWDNPIFELREIKLTNTQRAGKGRHQIKLKTVKGFQVGTNEWLYPEMVIVNSNDGCSKLEVSMGIYRKATNDDVMFAEPEFTFQLKHQCTEEEMAVQLVKLFADRMKSLKVIQQKLEEAVLDDETVLDIASAMCEYRFQQKFKSTEIKKLLDGITVPTAWNVLGYVQKIVMAGGFKIGSMMRHAKPIESIQQEMTFKTLASELVLISAA